MVGTMQSMRLATVERNAEFAEQLVGLQSRHASVVRMLEAEVVARDAFVSSWKATFAAAMQQLEAEASDALVSTFAVAAESVKPQHARLDGLHAQEREFYSSDVPRTNESMCGALIRTMDGHREALNLDQTTIKAREAKIGRRLDEHCVEYDVRCANEAEDREAQLARFIKQSQEAVRATPRTAKQTHCCMYR